MVPVVRCFAGLPWPSGVRAVVAIWRHQPSPGLCFIENCPGREPKKFVAFLHSSAWNNRAGPLRENAAKGSAVFNEGRVNRFVKTLVTT